jgi:hypothetical protein
MKAATPPSTEDLLKAMRQGNDQELWLKIGDIEVPCKILSQAEEMAAILNGKRRAIEKAPDGKISPVDESAAVMKAVLLAASNVKSVQYLATEFLNKLSAAALDSLYDQYVSIMRGVSPQFEQLSEARLAEMIQAVKKKEKGPRDFFTWELAAIGRSFLEEILQRDSAAGS